MIVPRSSPQLQHAPRMRITAWDVLVWAYAHENVRAVGGYLSLTNHYSVGEHWDDNVEMHTGTVRGYLQAHQDAVAIDNYVTKHTNDLQYLAITKAAEQRAPVPARLDLPTQRCVPVMVKRCGLMVPKMIYPARGRKEPIACCVDIVGVPLHEIENVQRRQAAMQGVFLALLDKMEARLELTKWTIYGRGLTAGGESLTEGITFGALREEA